MPKITAVTAREILNSRGQPTIETTIRLDSGHQGTASVPSGVAGSKYEAVELRDGDPRRFQGLGVSQAVNQINTDLSPKLKGTDPTQQAELDRRLIDWDGTADKSRYGANALLSISLAAVKAAAAYYGLPIYRYLQQKYYPQQPVRRIPGPILNVINGGAHGAGNLDFQEFHLIPSSRLPFTRALQLGEEVYQSLKQVLHHRRAITSVGDEGGFAPNLFTNLDALSAIAEALQPTGYQLTKDVFFGLDVAADWFYQQGRYEIKDRAQPFTEEELIAYYQELVKEFRLFALEDGLSQDSWGGWSRLTETLGDRTLIIGDDLLATNPGRVKTAIAKKACNAILIKPNQVGTVSETMAVISLCRRAGWKIIVSHRSGETNDTFIADFAVGIGADYTKFGAPARGERVAKYNRLLEIAGELKL